MAVAQASPVLLPLVQFQSYLFICLCISFKEILPLAKKTKQKNQNHFIRKTKSHTLLFDELSFIYPLFFFFFLQLEGTNVDSLPMKYVTSRMRQLQAYTYFPTVSLLLMRWDGKWGALLFTKVQLQESCYLLTPEWLWSRPVCSPTWDMQNKQIGNFVVLHFELIRLLVTSE